jgi:hypothetical protein
MDYNNGKIYTIRSPHTNKYYIGSSTQLLSKRFSVHKNSLDCSSKEIITLGDSYIELLENFSCKCKEELNAREYQLIREHKNNVVNILGVKSEDEKYENQVSTLKKYYEKNKDEIITQHKEYNKQNREHINARNREYKQKNKDKINARSRELNQENKDEKLAKRREQYRLKKQ